MTKQEIRNNAGLWASILDPWKITLQKCVALITKILQKTPIHHKNAVFLQLVWNIDNEERTQNRLNFANFAHRHSFKDGKRRIFRWQWNLQLYNTRRHMELFFLQESIQDSFPACLPVSSIRCWDINSRNGIQEK